MAISGKTWEDSAADLGPDTINRALSDYFDHLGVAALSSGTRNNRRAALRALSILVGDASEAAASVEPTSSVNPFWVAIFAKLDEADHITESRRAEIRKQGRAGYMPRCDNTVAKIAADVGLDLASLEKFIWNWKPEQLFDLGNATYTWAETHHVVTQLRYSMSSLPLLVESAVRPFLTWRRASSDRNLRLEQLDGSIQALQRAGGWTRRPGQAANDAPPTERISREFIENAFGFFALPTVGPDARLLGLGIPIEDLRLTDLFVGRNLTAYCDFMRRRNGRFDHGGLRKLRQDYCLLVGSKGSYGRFAQKALADNLRTSLDTAAKVHTAVDPGAAPDEGEFAMPDTPAAWHRWCDRQLKYLDDWIQVETQGRQGKAKYRAARSVEDNFELLFEKKKPIEQIVWPTVLWLADNRPPSYYPLHDRILHESKIFTIVGFIAEPFRLENWQAMRWGTHIFKRKGIWHVNTEAEEFKNRRALTKTYKSKIESSAQPYFERWYLLWMEAFEYDPLARENWHRISLVHAATRAKGPCSEPSHGLLRGRLKFLNVAWNLTVGPQSFRHLWATDWLKRHPEDYCTVAGKLNDTIEMVMERYGHLSSADHSARAEEMNAGVADRARAHLDTQLGTRP